MRKIFAVISLVAVIIACNDVFVQDKKDDIKKVINLADPTIYRSEKTWYLYGTNDLDASAGFIGYSSQNGRDWKQFTALNKGESYGAKGFWAPQIFEYRGKFYMAYTANENIAIAEADSPEGPFRQKVIKQLDAPVKQIDPFVFIDDDGKKYLYHVRLQDGNRLFVAEMNDDFTAIKENTLKECISGAVDTQPWENTANAPWTVSEGVTVLKHKGSYYLVYSANDFRNIDYAVGYATADNPLGPWKKYEGNPIISRKNIGINGTGHGDFFTDENGKLEYVFHTHHANDKVGPRKTAVVNAAFVHGDAALDKLIIDPQTFHYLEISQ